MIRCFVSVVVVVVVVVIVVVVIVIVIVVCQLMPQEKIFRSGMGQLGWSRLTDHCRPYKK